ncbi:GNAT family N-acetyltransferase [Catenulispora yoronensis]|uniref:GNAT family N-acetyltransferase n=1 Tax=Catenulispora yoronensis TaxID=450799 RepID=A0ABN2TN38_9ACTN
MTQLTALAPADVIPLRDELLAAALQSFAAPPWNEGPEDAAETVDRIWSHLDGRDFAGVVARDGEVLVGFAFGSTNSAYAALHPGPTVLTEAFELVELAVVPEYQGRGIGRALHDAVLVDAPSPRLLITHPDAPARTAYLRWAWADLGLVTMPEGGEWILMRHDAR